MSKNFRRVPAALMTAWLLAAPPAWAGYEDGMAAYRRGDHRTAHGEFRPAAESGDARSQYMLGRMYELGQEVVHDPAQAHMWYTLAAAQGNAEAAGARDMLAGRMTAEELARSRRMAAGMPVTPGAPPQVAESIAEPMEGPQTLAAVPPAPALTDADIRAAQTRLRALGYDAGPADGLAGPRTRRAVSAYQADAGLPVTGEITADLVTRLRTSALPGRAAANAQSVLAESGRLSAYTASVQQELRDHGYYAGAPSGVPDDRLRIAIEAYQRDAGLPVTGQVSEALLDHLKFARPEVSR